MNQWLIGGEAFWFANWTKLCLYKRFFLTTHSLHAFAKPSTSRYINKKNTIGSVGPVGKYLPWAPKTMKNKGFGHLQTRLFTIKTSKHGWFWGAPCYAYIITDYTHSLKNKSARLSFGQNDAVQVPHLLGGQSKMILGEVGQGWWLSWLCYLYADIYWYTYILLNIYIYIIILSLLYCMYCYNVPSDMQPILYTAWKRMAGLYEEQTHQPSRWTNLPGQQV